MPVETHHHCEAVTADEIVDLRVAVLVSSADLTDVGVDTLLHDLGVDTDLALFEMGDVVAAECGERCLGEIELDELWSARAVGALAQLFVQRRSGPGENADVAGRGDPT